MFPSVDSPSEMWPEMLFEQCWGSGSTRQMAWECQTEWTMESKSSMEEKTTDFHLQGSLGEILISFVDYALILNGANC